MTMVIVDALRRGGGIVAGTGTTTSGARSQFFFNATTIPYYRGGVIAWIQKSYYYKPRQRFQSSGVVRHLLSQSAIVSSSTTPKPAPIVKAVNNIITNTSNLHHHPRIKISSIVTETPHLLLLPKYCLAVVQSKNGIKKSGDDSFVVTAREYNGRTWFHAVYTDHAGEVFMSGLAKQVTTPTSTTTTHSPPTPQSSSSSSSFKTPLHLAETKIFNGKVYYSRLKMAEHAAAARAIDCYIHRENNNLIVLPAESEVPQLCFETPYSTIEEGLSQTPIDYDALLTIKKQQQQQHQQQQLPNFTQVANTSPFLLHVPKVMLNNVLQMCHIDCTGSFTVHKHESSYSRIVDNKVWLTATFTHPITNEIFTSGLTREVFVEKRNGASMLPPLHMVDARIIDEKVYYCNDSKLAEHAAAARAIDCYLYREEKEDERGNSTKWRLCYEEPYGTPEEGANVTTDYNTLLLERNTNICNEGVDNSNNLSQILPTTVEGGLPMSSINRSFSYSIQHMPHQLHVPMQFLSGAYLRVYSRKYGGSDTACYNVKVREYDDELWYTATFTDPFTNEQFSSGLGNIVNVKSRKREGSWLKTPLYQANVKVLDGKVYYNDKKLAKHAAAARAIDCYLLREQCVDGIKLCLEDPYISAEDGVAQSIDYDALLLQKDELLANDDDDDDDETITDSIPMEIGGSILSNARHHSHQLHVPKDFLNNSFYRKYGIYCSDFQHNCYEVKQCEMQHDKVVLSSTPWRGVGGHVQFLINDRDVVQVTSEDAKCWVLATGRIAKKATEGTSWIWSRDVPEESTDVGDTKWFTATFTDPITKERFSSGLGNIVRVKSHQNKSHQNTLKIPLYLANVKIVDGEVYYSEARLAEHAAAARAIDCYIFREDDVNNNVDRLCLEEPYGTLKDGVIPVTDYEALLNERNKLCTNEFERHKLLIEVEAGKDESRNLLKRDENSANQVYELDSSEDDIPVLTIPFVNGINEVVKVNNNMSTMGRILEIWTETTGHDSSSKQLYSKSKRQHESPSARIRSILNWYERVNNDPKSKEEAFALARLCNKILTALGEANCDQQLEGKDCVNIQKNAKTILDKIISLSISFDDKSDESLVDADTFTAYIRCLNRENPAYSAELAEFLLKSMQSNEYYQGINLPHPNVGTFNAVIGLWGQVDGVTGQSCANRVYSLLNSASMTRNEEHSLHPNEETVRLLMSVNSKKDSQFSFEHAKSWLRSFPNLVADVDVYSAALSTLSTNTSSDSLDPRYANWWISYGRHYVRGFKSAGTSSEEEAEEIAKWLLYAEECGIHPNADMYEAVIRAWLKTGTKDGLLSAEDWAKRAVSSNSRIRIETFHPIIAAWALCQFERAPARVEEWLNQLTGLSATKPHLKPDLQTLSALIISWRNVQAGIIARANEKTLSDSSVLTIPRGDADEKSRVVKDVEMAFTSAENCMQHLTDLYHRSKLDDIHDTMAMTCMFTHTIEAWGCASRFAQLYNSMGSASLDTSHGVHEMLKVHRLLDAKIENSIDTDEKDVLTNLQLMGESYAESIAQLNHIDTALDSEMIATTTPFFSREIADVERMLYEYDSYSRTHYPEGNFTLESNALRHRLYKEILRGCAGVKSSADYGHVIRLCRLIMDQLSWLDERCLDNNNNSGNTNGNYTSFVKDDITDIFVDMALLAGTTITNEHERTYVLSVMWNNANHFFEWNSSSRYEGGSGSNSNYATVDKARLIGAMRMAMKDSELTEPFLRNFDERPPKRKGRGNTWLAFVEDILRKGD